MYPMPCRIPLWRLSLLSELSDPARNLVPRKGYSRSAGGDLRVVRYATP